MRIRLPHVALVGVLAIGLTGGAVAAIPSADGTILACYATSDGRMRVADAESPAGRSCLPGEKPLSWAAPQGAAAPGYVREAVASQWYSGPQKPLATLSLPPNRSFTVTANAEAVRSNPNTSMKLYGSCLLAVKHGPAGAWQTLRTDTRRNVTQFMHDNLTMREHVTTGPTGAYVRISCGAQDGGYEDHVTFRDARVDATTLAGYTREMQ